ncbi:hypothetical protein V6Z12_A05G239800 [Gossypium hirsutum]
MKNQKHIVNVQVGSLARYKLLVKWEAGSGQAFVAVGEWAPSQYPSGQILKTSSSSHPVLYMLIVSTLLGLILCTKCIPFFVRVIRKIKKVTTINPHHFFKFRLKHNMYF